MKYRDVVASSDIPIALAGRALARKGGCCCLRNSFVFYLFFLHWKQASISCFMIQVLTHLRHSILLGSHAGNFITPLTILSLEQSHSVLSLQNNVYICTVIYRKRITNILVKVFSHYPTEEI